jgi:hypothetical protein
MTQLSLVTYHCSFCFTSSLTLPHSSVSKRANQDLDGWPLARGKPGSGVGPHWMGQEAPFKAWVAPNEWLWRLELLYSW